MVADKLGLSQTKSESISRSCIAVSRLIVKGSSSSASSQSSERSKVNW